jgi:hypothetical protein
MLTCDIGGQVIPEASRREVDAREKRARRLRRIRMTSLRYSDLADTVQRHGFMCPIAATIRVALVAIRG